MEKEKTGKYLCVHGHFYQPPRENPWIDFVQYQASADPYHDWNERITRECYGPNCRSRLHGKDGRIEKLVNNYSYMSFNFGPTLLTWLQENSRWIYDRIIEADKVSIERYGGHGNAIAQVYNHVIMPLASYHDKLTQIRWGIRDFQHRFERKPEGMWLAETAVDMETLRIMSEEGIKYTILSPDQASAVRPDNKSAHLKSKKVLKKSYGKWRDVPGGQIDTTMPYRVILDKNGSSFIDIFFYNGPLSRAIAFEKILTSGEDLMKRISESYRLNADRSELINIATDGESYGHHFKFGEMALAWVFNSIERNHDITLTNYGQYLEMFPPETEVAILNNSSWSCYHGIERWRSDCGCRVSHKPEWNQKWRTPLRDGLNWLSKELEKIYEKEAKAYLKDCQEGRDKFISILLDSKKGEKDFQNLLIKPLDNPEKKKIYTLLESQRMSMFMFTSCGWFFDDISGLEVRQILMYALRAIELCREWTGKDLEAELLKYLENANSNDPEYLNGANVYKEFVLPLKMTSSFIAAHYAISGLDERVQSEPWLNKIAFSLEETRIHEGENSAFIGKVRIKEKLTLAEQDHIFLALRINGKGFHCAVAEDKGETLHEVVSKISQPLSNGDFQACLDHFIFIFSDSSLYKLEDLIYDTKKWVINSFAVKLHSKIISSIELNSSLTENYTELIQRSEKKIPPESTVLFQLLLLESLHNVFIRQNPDLPADFSKINRITQLVSSEPDQISPDNIIPFETINNVFNQADTRDLIKTYLVHQVISLSDSNSSIHLNNIYGLINLINDVSMKIDLWEFQNIYFDLSINNCFISSLSDEDLLLFNKIGYITGFIARENQND